MSRLRGDAGFTLMELLVTMLLMSLLLGAVLATVEAFARQTDAEQRQGDLMDATRQSVDRMAALLRNAIGTSNGAALERATPYDVIFVVVDPTTTTPPGANAKNLMRVRYCLDSANPANERLLTQTETWSSPTTPVMPNTTLCPGGAPWGAAQLVSDKIVNPVVASPNGADGQLFVFRPSGWAQLSDISAVDFDVRVDDDTARRPPPSRLQSGVSLRNLNRMPTAQLQCDPTGGGNLTCDGSTSTDPDGQFLTYAWTESAGSSCAANPVAGETSAALSLSQAPGTWSIGLTVTDPGGLAASACRTVVVT